MLELQGNAQIKQLNIRREGAADDKHLAVDVKFHIETDTDVLTFFDPTLRTALFKKDTVALRYPMLKPLEWEGEMKHMEVDVSGLPFIEANLGKFTIQPVITADQREQVRLTFSASFSPTGREVAQLAELIGGDVYITIGAAPSLDLAPAAPKKPRGNGRAEIDVTPTLQLSGPPEPEPKPPKPPRKKKGPASGKKKSTKAPKTTKAPKQRRRTPPPAP